jgi:hypothetical protein
VANDDIGPALGHAGTAEDVCNVAHGALSHCAGGLVRGRAYHIASHGTAPHTCFGEADVTHGRAVHHPRPVNDVGRVVPRDAFAQLPAARLQARRRHQRCTLF